jgi:hypothetical protein
MVICQIRNLPVSYFILIEIINFKARRDMFNRTVHLQKPLTVLLMRMEIIIMGATTQGGSWPAQDNTSIGNG